MYAVMITLLAYQLEVRDDQKETCMYQLHPLKSALEGWREQLSQKNSVIQERYLPLPRDGGGRKVEDFHPHVSRGP